MERENLESFEMLLGYDNLRGRFGGVLVDEGEELLNVKESLLFT
jgi:hypothetical protein